MFGYSCSFVNGYFFAGMHEDNIVVRLMGTGKGMKDWWIIPAPFTKSGAKLAALLLDAFQEVRKLPPKPAKKRKAATATRSQAKRRS